MDPVTQGLLGGVVAQVLAKRKNAGCALLCGAIGGMAPDLDVFIRSDIDPLLSIEYHRHFTHSLAFIPVGGLLVAFFMYLFLRNRCSLKDLYIFSTAGYATHGLLDSCTAYGTRLYWPFSDYRVSWDLIAIIDPVYTVMLLVFVLLSAWKKSSTLAKVGCGLSVLYMGFGWYQHEAAIDQMQKLAGERGHKIERYRVMPTMANLVLWRSIYESDGRYFADAIYTNPFNGSFVKQGDSLRKFVTERDFPGLAGKQLNDLERFELFADGFLVMHPEKPNVVGDFRYSSMPDGTLPRWGIEVNQATPDEHVKRVGSGGDGRRKSMEKLLLMMDEIRTGIPQ